MKWPAFAIVASVGGVIYLAFAELGAGRISAKPNSVTQGSLISVDPQGQPRGACPGHTRRTRRSRPSAEEAQLVRNGKAEIQVWLVDSSPEVME